MVRGFFISTYVNIDVSSIFSAARLEFSQSSLSTFRNFAGSRQARCVLSNVKGMPIELDGDKSWTRES
jgi:hypothetical protein